MIRNKAEDDNHDDDDDDSPYLATVAATATCWLSTNATRRATSLHTKTHASHVCVDHSLAANRRRDDDASSLA